MAGPQQEWWFHKDGCGTWFAIWRDLTTDLEIQTKENEK
jgi:sarcosine oxidase delta subunit